METHTPQFGNTRLLKRFCIVTSILFFALGGAALACICGNNCEVIGDCCHDCGTGTDWCAQNCPNDCCGKSSNGTHVCGPSMCSPQILEFTLDADKPQDLSTLDEVEPTLIESEAHTLQVENKGGDTSLAEDVDPATERKGNNNQLLSQNDTQGSSEPADEKE